MTDKIIAEIKHARCYDILTCKGRAKTRGEI
jgi:hypothetical protein